MPQSEAQKKAFEKCLATRAANKAKKAAAAKDPALVNPSEPSLGEAHLPSFARQPEVAQPEPEPQPEPVQPEPEPVQPTPEPAPVITPIPPIPMEVDDDDWEILDPTEMLNAIKTQSELLQEMRTELKGLRDYQQDLSRSFTDHGVKTHLALNFV